MVNRKLRGINLSMIAVNATLGSGLYWTGGQVLKIGGPLAAPLSFLLPGLLAWAVMQCVTEMLCIWPIPGALSVYVAEFVDVELGIAVGVAYWFTYSVSFAALIATSAAEIHLWLPTSKVFDGVVVYLLIPVTLVLINTFEVEIYGWLEVAGSSIKITCLVVVMILVGVLMDESPVHPKGIELWRAPVVFDRDVTNNWATAFAICLSMATFAYVGVEVVAASALEARWPSRKEPSKRNGDDLLISKTVKFSAVYIPMFATAAYTLAALLASLSIDRGDCHLPRLSWINSSCGSGPQGGTASIFVVIARNSTRPALKDIFNVILVFSVLTCANTNLYVASRTLFGLTTRLDGSPTQQPLLRFLAWFGRTNRRKVPLRALIFSAVAFLWVPFLQLDEGNDISEVSEH
ncbi:amino acid transporter [Ophiocordyceps camponoti-floridani]|uniref:Amino acid transporter n=1 Tax=Ophiocordyceps camponoti-floridani TaxID=2030778 RepID=A0A8H4Q4Y6_9HYPO|nr:amino acid transporter [Ophiocordyceps camponoti-floridani]